MFVLIFLTISLSTPILKLQAFAAAKYLIKDFCMYIEDLTEVDYQILKYFKENSPSSIEDAAKHLPNVEALEYRIRFLSTPEFRQSTNFSIPIENTKCLHEEFETYNDGCITKHRCLGIFSITTLGKKALQDYETSQKQQKKDIWLKNVWTPILVTIITNLVISGIKW